MDRAKVAVFLVGLFGFATVAQGIGLASIVGFRPQLSLFFGSGFVISGVAVRTLHQNRYDEFALFRKRDLAFWAVAVGVVGYLAVVGLQFL